MRVAVEEGCSEVIGTAAGRAAGKGDLQMVRWLVEREVGVGCWHRRASIDTTVIECAAVNGHIHLLEWMFGRGLFANEGPSAAFYAASTGELETLKWLGRRGVRFDEQVMAAAAREASLSTLRWLRDVAHCPWDAGACEQAAAAMAGTRSLEALQWLVERGCPLSKEVWDCSSRESGASLVAMRKFFCTLPERPWDDKLVLWAVTSRDMDTMLWALAHEPGADDALKTGGYAAAIRSGEVRMLKGVRDRCSDACEWSDDALVALGRACPDMMRACFSMGCPLSCRTWKPLLIADWAENFARLLPRLELLCERGCPWDDSVAADAAAVRYRAPAESAALLQWMRAHGCPVDAGTCAAAAKHSLPLLQQLRAAVFPWDGSTCAAAAQAGQLATLQWAHEQACPLGDCSGLIVTDHGVRAWLQAQGVATIAPE